MSHKKARDAWKYENIYQKKGVLSKINAHKKVTGTFDFFQSQNLAGKWKKYGHSNEGKNYLSQILALKPTSIVDIGCGGNEFCASVKRRKRYFFNRIKCIGVDIACPEADVIAPANDLSFASNKEFDLLTSFDCLEHVPEEEIDEAFSEFKRISRRVFLQICLEESPTLMDGQPLHVCIKPKEWWLDIAKKHFFEITSYEEGSARFDTNKNRVVYSFQGEKVRELIITGKCY